MLKTWNLFKDDKKKFIPQSAPQDDYYPNVKEARRSWRRSSLLKSILKDDKKKFISQTVPQDDDFPNVKETREAYDALHSLIQSRQKGVYITRRPSISWAIDDKTLKVESMSVRWSLWCSPFLSHRPSIDRLKIDKKKFTIFVIPKINEQ